MRFTAFFVLHKFFFSQHAVFIIGFFPHREGHIDLQCFHFFHSERKTFPKEYARMANSSTAMQSQSKVAIPHPQGYLLQTQPTPKRYIDAMVPPLISHQIAILCFACGGYLCDQKNTRFKSASNKAAGNPFKVPHLN